jgi:hypothetical protein
MSKIHCKFFLLLICLLVVQNFVARAQEIQPSSNNLQQSAESYEVMLQLLVAGDAGEHEDLPQNLTLIERKLKNDFGASNYRLAMTLLSRASEKGTIESKGIGLINKSQSNDPKSFYEIVLSNIKANKQVERELAMDYLRFGLRVPVISAPQNEKGGFPVVNYEHVGITAKPLNMTLDEPTIVGTLTTSRANEFIVVVLTVKPESSNRKQIAKKK